MITISFFTYKTSKLSPIMLVAIFILVLIPESRSQSFPDPHLYPSDVQQLCVAQFALANHACLSILSVSHSHSSTLTQINLVPPSSDQLAPSPEPEFDILYHNHKNGRGGRGHQHDREGHGRQHGREGHKRQHGHEGQGHQHGREGHGRQHGRGGHNRQHGREGHGRQHGHGHQHGHDLHEKRECCRWLKAIDEDCVCAMLRVKLPVALSIPDHGYKVDVEDECEVEFECSAVDD